MQPIKYIYDGTFEGFLTVIFHAFQNRSTPSAILSAGDDSPDLFSTVESISTDQEKSTRVWNGIVRYSSEKNAHLLHVAFLSSIPETPMLLWRYLNKLFTCKQKDFYQNMLDDEVQQMVQTARKVKKEAHLFLGLVRFQHTSDNIYFAPIDPDHDILPLIVKHFKSRYANQRWVIYDTGRNYGIFYNLEELEEVRIDNPEFDFLTGKLTPQVKEDREDQWQKLWQQYYKSVNIQGRKNTKQMTRLLPRRYWKFLPEKEMRDE